MHIEDRTQRFCEKDLSADQDWSDGDDALRDQYSSRFGSRIGLGLALWLLSLSQSRRQRLDALVQIRMGDKVEVGEHDRRR